MVSLPRVPDFGRRMNVDRTEKEMEELDSFLAVLPPALDTKFSSQYSEPSLSPCSTNHKAPQK